jgi:class 3 adenylate cyclase
MHLRIDLGAGESTVKDGDYFGVPTIEAARLCAQAPSDGILISATMRLLAGHCDGIELSSIGELELKRASAVSDRPASRCAVLRLSAAFAHRPVVRR